MPSVLKLSTDAARRVRAALVVGTSAVLALYLFILAVDPLGHVGGLRDVVDLGGRNNIPRWWSAALMLLMAVAAIAGRTVTPVGRRDRLAWTLLAIAAGARSLDEVARPLEVFAQWANEMGLHLVPDSWPVLAAAGMVVMSWAWWALPSRQLRAQLALAACVYALGAVGVDRLNDLIERSSHGALFVVGTVTEELLEMGGAVLAVTAIVDWVLADLSRRSALAGARGLARPIGEAEAQDRPSPTGSRGSI